MQFCDTYSQIKKVKPPTLRNSLRNIALNVLSVEAQLRFQYSLNTPRIQFLYIHHLFSDELRNFELLIKELSKSHTFISYSEAVNKLTNGTIDKPYIVFSSDDGFKNNLNAIDILKDYGSSCCFFINPTSIELSSMKDKAAFCSSRLNFPLVDFLNWDDVDLLLKYGFEIGSHTMNHFDLSTITEAQLDEELGLSFEKIKSKTGTHVHFAFPYGRIRNITQRAFEKVYKTGYMSCASAERGAHYSDSIIDRETLYIRRDHMVMDWKINHMMYFIIRNARELNNSSNRYPKK